MIIQQTNALTVHDVLQRLATHKSTLLIHTIPGEEWRLSCYRHKTLLVDVYRLTGTIAGTKRVQSWECGRLCELLIKLLRYGRKAHYLSLRTQEENVSVLTNTRLASRLAETLEDDMILRLKGGDIVFHATGEAWRLTNTCFGQLEYSHMFYLAKEETIGTSELLMFKDHNLQTILLDFLCQKAEFTETTEPKILEFRGVLI